MKKIILSALFISCVLIGAGTARAETIAATLPELAWVVKEMAPDLKVETLIKGTEDVHRVEAKPSLILQTAKADALLMVGLQLEIGWVPKLIDKAGNKNLTGARIYEAGSALSNCLLERQTVAVDRSMGDLHPFGNPHFWMSPSCLKEASTGIEKWLNTQFPKTKTDSAKLHAKLDGLSKKLDALSKEKKFSEGTGLEYHKEFTYLFEALGILAKARSSIEEKPGVPPSISRLETVAKNAKANPPKLILAAPSALPKTLEKFTELSGLKVLGLRSHLKIGEDYEGFMNEVIQTLQK